MYTINNNSAASIPSSIAGILGTMTESRFEEHRKSMLRGAKRRWWIEGEVGANQNAKLTR